MSNSKIRTALLHLRDSDDPDDQKLIYYADFRIHHQNLADATGSVRISEFDMKTWWIIFNSAGLTVSTMDSTLLTLVIILCTGIFKHYYFLKIPIGFNFISIDIQLEYLYITEKNLFEY